VQPPFLQEPRERDPQDDAEEDQRRAGHQILNPPSALDADTKAGALLGFALEPPRHVRNDPLLEHGNEVGHHPASVGKAQQRSAVGNHFADRAPQPQQRNAIKSDAVRSRGAEPIESVIVDDDPIDGPAAKICADDEDRAADGDQEPGEGCPEGPVLFESGQPPDRSAKQSAREGARQRDQRREKNIDEEAPDEILPDSPDFDGAGRNVGHLEPVSWTSIPLLGLLGIH
jgi:hypothetical protein